MSRSQLFTGFPPRFSAFFFSGAFPLSSAVKCHVGWVSLNGVFCGEFAVEDVCLGVSLGADCFESNLCLNKLMNYLR